MRRGADERAYAAIKDFTHEWSGVFTLFFMAAIVFFLCGR
jgi:hypothetical protein